MPETSNTIQLKCPILRPVCNRLSSSSVFKAGLCQSHQLLTLKLSRKWEEKKEHKKPKARSQELSTTYVLSQIHKCFPLFVVVFQKVTFSGLFDLEKQKQKPRHLILIFLKIIFNNWQNCKCLLLKNFPLKIKVLTFLINIEQQVDFFFFLPWHTLVCHRMACYIKVLSPLLVGSDLCWALWTAAVV